MLTNLTLKTMQEPLVEYDVELVISFLQYLLFFSSSNEFITFSCFDFHSRLSTSKRRRCSLQTARRWQHDTRRQIPCGVMGLTCY